VRETGKDESNFIVVWALGVYPVESEDREMEITLFSLVNEYERDSNMSFESLISRVAQDILEEIDSESAMFKLSVNDYAGKNYSFVIKVVFPHNSSRFKYLMSSLRPNESTLFVVGHMEVIQEDLYVYAADVSFVVVNSAVKRKVSSL
ncbi:14993_t:CDS:2, partial [Racocetra persica]